MDCTVGTTGFINYFTSSERTSMKVKNAVDKYGTDIVIINGEDDWNCSKAFCIEYLFDRFGIEKLDKFHDGISGITTSGAVIKKTDLPTFIAKYNKIKYELMRAHVGSHIGWRGDGQIKTFDVEHGWRIFFWAEIGRKGLPGLHRYVVNYKQLKTA